MPAVASTAVATLFLAGYAFWAIYLAPIAAATGIIGQTVELATPPARERSEATARSDFQAAQSRLHRRERDLGLGAHPRAATLGERDRLESDRRDVAEKLNALEAMRGERPQPD